EVLGKYHPHGDMAVYDALVRMAQDFSLRYRLVDGQGNFGSVDGDSPAAMRYTEARLSKPAAEILSDIGKETVNFIDNFDGSLQEPEVLPSKFPNLLVNGSSGIAVGMATNIPPHNLGEIVDGITMLIENPEADITELMEVIKGPDFPTGGTIYGISGVVSAYHLGRGRVVIRAKSDVEVHKKRKRIIVTEIPYQVNKSSLIENIASLVKDKKIEGISGLRDESDRDGMRIVIELRRDAMEEIVLNQLFAHTQMQTTFGIINLAIVDGAPKIMNLKETLLKYVEFREEIIRKRTEFDRKKASDRAHILEGLMIAIDNLDEVITLIRRSKEAKDAIGKLTSKFILTEEQAKAILDMKLQKLAATERQGIRDEHANLVKSIAEFREILASRQRILDIIKNELLELKEKYGDERRTQIESEGEEILIEDLIPVEDNVITITHTGYIKRLPIDTYRMQRRGGVGLVGMGTKEEDFVIDVFVASTHDYILFFTSKGRVHWLKAYRIPLGGRHARGKPVVNLLPRLEDGETIKSMIPVKEFDKDRNLIFATRKGLIKKTKLSAYSRPRVTGIWAIKLRKGDELVETKLTDGTKEIILASKKGKAARFPERLVRSTGRYSMGVKGIGLKGGDKLVGMAVVDEKSVLLTITENGFGKRTPVSMYRKTNRGAGGVITIRTVKRNGDVVCIREVSDEHELILISEYGRVIRIPAKGIRIQGRATMGVRVMRLHKDDKVMALARLIKEEKEVEEKVEEAEKERGDEPVADMLKEEESPADLEEIIDMKEKVPEKKAPEKKYKKVKGTKTKKEK
ncbi:MAG: DNA gyrase subunit A, partial [Thermoplasmata archaeon]|nr:DNA gyrase subunit A [Thermoplasmata archaeon]